MSAPGKPLVERPRRRDGYYIKANLRPNPRRADGRYDHAVWPILFETREAAEAHMEHVSGALFQNAGGKGFSASKVPPCLIPGKTRIVSFSVERTKGWWRHAAEGAASLGPQQIRLLRDLAVGRNPFGQVRYRSQGYRSLRRSEDALRGRGLIEGYHPSRLTLLGVDALRQRTEPA